MNKFLKNSIFCLVCLFLNNHLFAQLKDPKDNLENVKSFNVYLYKVYDVETKKDKITFYKKAQTIAHSLFEYDTNGNEILQNYYHPATDKLQKSYVFEYDSNNQLIQEINVLEGKIFGGKTVYSYDKQGRKSQLIAYSGKEEVTKMIKFEYDSIGNLIAEKSRNLMSMIIKEIQYKYDERNNQIEKRNVKTFLKNNKPYLEIQSFDDANRLISKVHYDDKDSLTWEYTAVYDSKNKLIEERTKNGNGKVVANAFYTYNKKGVMTSSYSFDMLQKSPPMRIEYQYDKKGLNTLRYIYVQDAKTPTITKRYYYDEKGNWYMWHEINHADNMQAIANRKVVYF